MYNIVNRNSHIRFNSETVHVHTAWIDSAKHFGGSNLVCESRTLVQKTVEQGVCALPEIMTLCEKK